MGFSLKNLYGNQWLKQIRFFFKKEKEWQDIEFFNEEWKDRIMLMASFIEKESSVMDLGCGRMWLLDFLPENCTYLRLIILKDHLTALLPILIKNNFRA